MTYQQQQQPVQYGQQPVAGNGMVPVQMQGQQGGQIMYAQPHQQQHSQPQQYISQGQQPQQYVMQGQPVMMQQPNGQQIMMVPAQQQPQQMMMQGGQPQMMTQQVITTTTTQQNNVSQTQAVAHNLPERPPMIIACFVNCIFSRKAVRDRRRGRSTCFACGPIACWIFGIMFLIGGFALVVSSPVNGVILLLLGFGLSFLAVLMTYALCWGSARGYEEGVQYPDMQRGGLLNTCLIM